MGDSKRPNVTTNRQDELVATYALWEKRMAWLARSVKSLPMIFQSAMSPHHDGHMLNRKTVNGSDLKP
jgi:hypothetical protein